MSDASHSILATSLANSFVNGNRLYVIEVLTKQLTTTGCALLTAKVMANLSEQHQGDLIALFEQAHETEDE